MNSLPDSVVQIHGNPWKLADLQDAIADCLTRKWTLQSWKAGPALIHRTGGVASLYHGQKFDPEKIDLVPQGWRHDHCQICWWELFDSDDAAHSAGYNSGTDWICTECYDKFIASSGVDGQPS